MGDLTVESYEDGGAMPLCDVVRNKKVLDDILPPGAKGYFGGIPCRQGLNNL